MKKRLLCILLFALVLLTSLISFADPEPGEADAGSDTDAGGEVAGHIELTENMYHSYLANGEKMAESDTLELYLVKVSDEEKGIKDAPNIVIKDKRSGHEWYSFTNMEGMNTTWAKKIRSLVLLYYVVFKETKSVATETTALDASKAEISKINNGFKIHYEYSNLDIKFDVHFTIEGDELVVDIPFDSIVEGNGQGAPKAGIVSIEVLPFLGASNEDTPGYVFYPDGSGALLYHKAKSEIDKQSKLTLEVYGEHSVDLEIYEKLEESSLKTTNMPVFGMKQNDNSYLAIISKGEADSLINLYPSGYIMALDRISGEFVYRRFYNTPRQDKTIVLKSEKNIIPNDRQMRYVFLTGEDSDYSGMARAYRKYLVETGNINNVLKDATAMPFGLDLFMGIKEDRLIFDKYIPMTTFANAEEIYNLLIENGVQNINLNLIGWNKGGYGEYPQTFKPDRRLGGVRGLKKLAETVTQSGGSIFLEGNLIDANKKNGGFSVRNDVIYTNSNTLITDPKSQKYLLGPKVVLERFTKKFVNKYAGLGISGFNFDKMGTYLYNDYNKKNPVTRQDAQNIWSEIFNASNEQFGKSAVIGGNMYALKDVSYVQDVPISDSGYFVTDEAIPFYQLVVHGFLPYVSNQANLFYDATIQKLKWVEYGCIPYYELTYLTSDNLKDTEYNVLFTSYYKDWIDTCSETYKEFSERLGDLYKTNMRRHFKLNENVYGVEYENGDTVYVNYGNYDFVLDSGEVVPKTSYIVVTSGGDIR
ncbi:MAG: hypothetical protein GX196_03325 [Clostridiaceae bacterium]|nr:hypothetical protein [Clostridiaceae bacterium]